MAQACCRASAQREGSVGLWAQAYTTQDFPQGLLRASVSELSMEPEDPIV